MGGEESASTPAANEPAKDLILVHTVQLKPMIKAHFSGRTVKIDDVVFTSVHYEKAHLKKLMMRMRIMISEKTFTSK